MIINNKIKNKVLRYTNFESYILYSFYNKNFCKYSCLIYKKYEISYKVLYFCDTKKQIPKIIILLMHNQLRLFLKTSNQEKILRTQDFFESFHLLRVIFPICSVIFLRKLQYR